MEPGVGVGAKEKVKGRVGATRMLERGTDGVVGIPGQERVGRVIGLETVEGVRATALLPRVTGERGKEVAVRATVRGARVTGRETDGVAGATFPKKLLPLICVSPYLRPMQIQGRDGGMRARGAKAS